MLAEAEVLTPFRCARCWELEEADIETLLCNVCHYAAESPAPPPPPAPADHDRSSSRERLALSAGERERYDYWLELMLDAGWETQVARRAALDRVHSPSRTRPIR